MRNFLLVLVISFVSIAAAAAPVSQNFQTKLPRQLLQILPYETFAVMPEDQQIKYLRELRGFIAQQEGKWTGKTVGENQTPFDEFVKLFSLVDEAYAQNPPNQAPPVPAQAAPTSDPNIFDSGDCKLGNLPSYLQSYVVGGHDKCEIGGYMVCLSVTSDGSGGQHLRCTPNDPNNTKFADFSKQVCKGQGDNMVPCAPPLYAKDADGSQLCVPRNGKSISSQCDSQSKIDALVKNMTKNKENFRKYYNDFRKHVEGYCEDVVGSKTNLHTFDKKDCEALETRLDNIRCVYAATNQGVLCEPESVLYKGSKGTNGAADTADTSVTVKMSMNPQCTEKGKYGISSNDGSWTRTKCSQDGRPTDLNLPKDDNYEANEWESCLARKGADGGTEVLRMNRDCKVHREVIKSGVYNDKGTPQCQISGFGDKTITKTTDANNPVTYQAGSAKPVSLALVPNSDTKATVQYYANGPVDGDGTTQFIFDPNNKDPNARCTATYQTTLHKNKDNAKDTNGKEYGAPETGQK